MPWGRCCGRCSSATHPADADLLTHTFGIASLAPTLAALIGLGVGIDYALFIVTRHRRGLLRGLEPMEAAAVALSTSGRAVLFAGGTVCIALLGMLVLGVTFLNGVAIAAALTVLFTVLSVITSSAGPRSCRWRPSRSWSP